MEHNDREKAQPINYCIDLFLGSGVKVQRAVLTKILRQHNVGRYAQAKAVVFDHSASLPSDEASALGLGPEDQIDPDTHVKAAMPSDTASLEEAEQDGLLMAMPEGWYRNPGPCIDSKGACCEPPIGYTILGLQRREFMNTLSKAFRQTSEYARRQAAAAGDVTLFDAPPRIAVRLIFSTVGATGTGSFYPLIEGMIRDCAKHNGVQVKIVLDIIARGNLPITNGERGVLSEQVTEQYLRAAATGARVDEATGTVQPALFDLLYMATNMGRYGSIATFAGLLTHQAQVDWFFWHTPAGDTMRERAVDTERFGCNEYGDPECVHMVSVAAFHWDRERAIQYHACRAAEELAHSLLEEGDPQKALDDAAALVRHAGLSETEVDSDITRPMLRSQELGESCIQKANSSLTDQLGKSRGYQKAKRAENALATILDDEIPHVLFPLMCQEAQRDAESAIATIEGYTQQGLRAPRGASQVSMTLAYVRAAAEQSKEVISNKEADIHEFLGPHHDIRAEASEQLQQATESGTLGRVLNTLLFGRIAGAIEQSGRALIGGTIELEACRVAVQEFLARVIEYLDRKLAWLTLYPQKLLRSKQSCASKITSIVEAPTTCSVPNGEEFASAQNLRSSFAEQVDAHGGPERFRAHLRNLFLKKYGSFSVLAEAPEHNILEILIDLGRGLFEPILQARNVYTEFHRCYPDEKARKQRVLLRVQESEGRLIVEREVNKEVVWIKTANVPCDAARVYLQDLLEGLDKKPGIWNISVSDDSETISFAQLRGGISLTPFIERIAVPDTPEGWRLAIKQAVHPGTTVMAPPNPNLRQVKRVLCKAIVTGLMTVRDREFVVTDPSGKELLLGTSLDSVAERTRRLYSQSVFVESTFDRSLVVAEAETIDKLNRLNAHLASDADDPLLQLIDATAVEECLIQAELLLPKLRRFRRPPRRKLFT